MSNAEGTSLESRGYGARFGRIGPIDVRDATPAAYRLDQPSGFECAHHLHERLVDRAAGCGGSNEQVSCLSPERRLLKSRRKRVNQFLRFGQGRDSAAIPQNNRPPEFRVRRHDRPPKALDPSRTLAAAGAIVRKSLGRVSASAWAPTVPTAVPSIWGRRPSAIRLGAQPSARRG